MTQTLFILRGVPASGKSTFAMRWVAEKSHIRSRVNRDDIRYNNFGKYVLDPSDEMAVTTIEHATITALLKAGRSVVIDNQNLRAKYVKEYLRIAAKFGATVMFKDFPIELDEALRRNAARDRKVPEEVLRKIYANFVRKGSFPPLPTLDDGATDLDTYVPDSTLPTAWIVDIDGTLATIIEGGRSPYDFSRVLEDEVQEHVARLVRLLAADGAKILITSGRSDISREDTETWLQANEVPYDRLFMRKEGDSRKDSIIKREIFDEHIRYHYNVQGVLDDRQAVVRMWHALGLKLLRVGDPDADF